MRRGAVEHNGRRERFLFVSVPINGRLLLAAIYLAVVLGGQRTFASITGEQALVFRNRRGYAPLTLCRACGHRMRSPDSDRP